MKSTAPAAARKATLVLVDAPTWSAIVRRDTLRALRIGDIGIAPPTARRAHHATAGRDVVRPRRRWAPTDTGRVRVRR